MDDPVVAADGHTYNRADIENWFKEHDTSPHTNETLESKALFPNIDKRRQINAWREQHGLPALSFGPRLSAQFQGGASVATPPGGSQLVKPAVVCLLSKKPLQAYCITCKKSICVNCAIDATRCKSHNTRPLDSIVSDAREAHAAWMRVAERWPQQLQLECDRVDAAAHAAIQAIIEESASLKEELQRTSMDDLEGAIQEHAQQLVTIAQAAASPDSAVAGSESARCLLAAVARKPRLPPPGAHFGGRFEANSSESSSAKRLGRVVSGGGVKLLTKVGGVSATGAGFLRLFGRRGSDVGQFQSPIFCAFDAEGNLVVSDYSNHRIQVLRYSDGKHLRTIGSQGSGNGQFSNPMGFAFDDAGRILVADCGNNRVQVLRYSDGAHVRSVGSRGNGHGQLNGPTAVVCDRAGNFAVFDSTNARVQVFQGSDGLHVRSFGGMNSGLFGGSWGFLAFDGEGNLVVSEFSSRIQVLRYSDGRHLRTIGSQGSGNGQFSNPASIAFDGAGHILVADFSNHHVQVLRYSDGAHVRTIGCFGNSNGEFSGPISVAVDSDGRIVVCDNSNHRLQVLE
jgi:DNA-binding beta-propeller fold protein YncE